MAVTRVTPDNVLFSLVSRDVRMAELEEENARLREELAGVTASLALTQNERDNQATLANLLRDELEKFKAAHGHETNGRPRRVRNRVAAAECTPAELPPVVGGEGG